jgi:hypothetical protein
MFDVCPTARTTGILIKEVDVSDSSIFRKVFRDIELGFCFFIVVKIDNN